MGPINYITRWDNPHKTDNVNVVNLRAGQAANSSQEDQKARWNHKGRKQYLNINKQSRVIHKNNRENTRDRSEMSARAKQDFALNRRKCGA